MSQIAAVKKRSTTVLTRASERPWAPSLKAHTRDDTFLRMLDAYRCSGGLLRVGDLEVLVEGGHGQAVGTLVQWMDQHEVICFEWQRQTWLPRFQFDMVAKAPHEAVGHVTKVLAGVFDNWQIALWFAHPSSMLEGRIPADAMRSDPERVLLAARQASLH